MINEINVWSSTPIEDLQRIRNLAPKMESILLLGQLESNYGVLFGQKKYAEDLVDISLEYNKPLHILTGGHHSNSLEFDFTNERYKNVTISYWPSFWLTLTLERLSTGTTQRINSEYGFYPYDMEIGNKFTDFDYLFVCLNKIPKYHRAMFIDILYNNNLFSHGAITWREPAESYQYKYWKEEFLFLDQKEKFWNQEIFPEEYKRSFMQIVTESQDQCFFLTEKTTMPLFWNKPFLVVGCVNYHNILKEMGFKLYTEIFDYSFDTEPNMEIRYQQICNNVNKYKNCNKSQLQKIYQTIYPKLLYNKKHAFKLALDIDNFPKIWLEYEKKFCENNILDYPLLINKFVRSKNNEIKFFKI